MISEIFGFQLLNLIKHEGKPLKIFSTFDFSLNKNQHINQQLY